LEDLEEPLKEGSENKLIFNRKYKRNSAKIREYFNYNLLSKISSVGIGREYLWYIFGDENLNFSNSSPKSLSTQNGIFWENFKLIDKFVDYTKLNVEVLNGVLEQYAFNELDY
jgi:hypothetical protein